MNTSASLSGPEAISSWFAPAARMPPEELRQVSQLCAANPVIQTVLDSVDGYILILNAQRQILAANPELLKLLNFHQGDSLLGQRPGEALNCVYSQVGPGGCGTSRNCSTCGAVIAIMASQLDEEPVTNECLLSFERSGVLEAREFHVRATPLVIDGQRLTIFVLHNISDAKRRALLERVFLHDVSNILTGLVGWSDLLTRKPQDSAKIASKIVRISGQLTEVLESQRLLLQAEQGELEVALSTVTVESLFSQLQSVFAELSPGPAVRLKMALPARPVSVHTSPALLGRILGNMVKNAFEAILPTEEVRVWFSVERGRPSFFVHNPGEIPERVALQVFKRSFSTKAASGRGLGTYGMKLFGERYLGGEVGFSSSREGGTRFHVRLPPESLLPECGG